MKTVYERLLVRPGSGHDPPSLEPNKYSCFSKGTRRTFLVSPLLVEDGSVGGAVVREGARQ